MTLQEAVEVFNRNKHRGRDDWYIVTENDEPDGRVIGVGSRRWVQVEIDNEIETFGVMPSDALIIARYYLARDEFEAEIEQIIQETCPRCARGDDVARLDVNEWSMQKCQWGHGVWPCRASAIRERRYQREQSK